jgi:hypothetical protein
VKINKINYLPINISAYLGKDVSKMPKAKKPSKTKSLIKSKKRVQDAGEVFTPDFLVEKMLDQFPEEAWGKNKNWLEPTCGNGQFIVSIIKRKINNGNSLLEALETTFGMDIMKDNIRECRKRIRDEILAPFILINGIRGKEKAKLVRLVDRIIRNNIINTEDSLKEDWNNTFKPITYRKTNR